MPTVYSPPVSTYVSLATYTVTGSPGAEVIFSSIPATYRDLVLVTANAGTTAGSKMGLRINGDTGASYPYVRMFNTGSQAFSITGSMFDGGELGGANTLTSIIQIMDYSATDKHKTGLTRWNNPTTWVAANAFRWTNTAVITTLSLAPYDANSGSQSGSFIVGSTFSLYGIAA
jgi:hypothetical protein